MKLLKRSITVFSLVALICFASCKKNEATDNDGMKEAPGSFEDNHTKTDTDTSKSSVDSTTSNSTQTDPTAS